jgi:HK97 family phage prohead protease
MVFEGYASTFDNADIVGDVFRKGAFDAADTATTRMLLNHDHSMVIGKWLDMQQDDHGLFVRGELTPGHSVAQDVYASLKHGAITAMSVGFRIGESTENKSGGRDILKADLIETSLVAVPANSMAQITEVRSAIEAIESLKSAEAVLRDVGFSRSEAKHFVSAVSGILQRDAVNATNQREADANLTKAELITALEILKLS